MAEAKGDRIAKLMARAGLCSRRDAERMVEEGAYDLACSDAHRHDDVELVERGIEPVRRPDAEDALHLVEAVEQGAVGLRQ